MALSQVALNVFYLFNGRKILCRPKRKAHTRALRLHGDVPSEGVWMHPHMCIHLQPCSVWDLGVLLHGNECAEAGVCCRVWMSALSRAAEGWAALGFQLPAAPRWLWALGGQSSATGHSGEVCTEWIQGKWNPGLGFHEEGTQWTQYCTGYCHLFFMFVLFSASLLLLLNIYFMLNGSTDVQKAISVESEGAYSALICKPESTITQTSTERVGHNWLEFLLPSLLPALL